MQDLPCHFRSEPHNTPEGEQATCGLLQQLTQVDVQGIAPNWTALVPRSACEACCDSPPLRSILENSTFASLLYSCCERLSATQGIGDASQQRLRGLQQLAELALGDEALATARSNPITCDVFICCTDSAEPTRRAIDSLLAQREAIAIIHLIDDGGGAQQLAQTYEQHWNVCVHRNDQREGLFASVQKFVSECRTEFIALQSTAATSAPDRLRSSVEAIERLGGDVFAAAIQTSHGVLPASQPEVRYERFVCWPSLVFRRETFLDMGGFAERTDDQDVEFIYRASCEDRRLLVSSETLVEFSVAWQPAAPGPKPAYAAGDGSLRKQAIGFAHQPVACDVVIPFRGQLEYLQPAIESVLDQQNAETIIHLIDDASQESTDEVLRFWRTHPRLRVYRNERNIGQYASFNNVSQFFETEFVGVQDADDISLPDRCSVSGNLLRLSDADFFGAAMEQFGDLERLGSAADRVRHSFHPQPSWVGYFLMNPTAFFRTAMFRSLGGYANFGALPQHNRAGLDSELLVRAYYSGVRFAISRDVVTQHRIHPDSATQNAATGFGSQIRNSAFRECDRRRKLFQAGHFDPKAFGAINRFRGVTRRY